MTRAYTGGRETWEALAVAGPLSCSLSSPSLDSEVEEPEELDSPSDSEGRPMRSLCFFDILRARFGRDSYVVDI
jgi:hypothetical protein